MPVSPSSPAGARPGAAPETAAAIWRVITTMYEAYSAGDPARIDACLDPEATVWDSGTAGLLFGKPDLDRVREGRPTGGVGPVEIRTVLRLCSSAALLALVPRRTPSGSV